MRKWPWKIWPRKNWPHKIAMAKLAKYVNGHGKIGHRKIDRFGKWGKCSTVPLVSILNIVGAIIVLFVNVIVLRQFSVYI